MASVYSTGAEMSKLTSKMELADRSQPDRKGPARLTRVFPCRLVLTEIWSEQIVEV